MGKQRQVENIFVFLHLKHQIDFMELNFEGILIAVCTFIIIGVFHPIVIKVEYYFGTRLWWLTNVLQSALLGVLGASSLWSIGELFEQKKRVEKGWFPMNPKREHHYNKK